MNKGPECFKCGTDDVNFDVVVCTQCLEKPVCCECATPLQRYLEVCSDDCAIAKIIRLNKVPTPSTSRIQPQIEKQRKVA